jgi:hypothetical protein
LLYLRIPVIAIGQFHSIPLLVGDPFGELKTHALLYTNLEVDSDKILSWFVVSWRLELDNLHQAPKCKQSVEAERVLTHLQFFLYISKIHPIFIRNSSPAVRVL